MTRRRASRVRRRWNHARRAAKRSRTGRYFAPWQPWLCRDPRMAELILRRYGWLK